MRKTESQKIATGFHRNTQINQEGGIDKEQFRIDSVFDRVATTGTVWLGLSVGCAQCHDHKFDPLTQQDYYALAGVFTSSQVVGAKGPATGGVEVPGEPGVKILALTDAAKGVGDTNLLVTANNGTAPSASATILTWKSRFSTCLSRSGL